MSETETSERHIYGGRANGECWAVVLRGRGIAPAVRSTADVEALGEKLGELSAQFGIPLAIVIGCDNPQDCWHEESGTMGASATLGIPLVAATSVAGLDALASSEAGMSDHDVAMASGANIAERLALRIPDALWAELAAMFPDIEKSEGLLLGIGGWTMATLQLEGEAIVASAEDGAPRPIDASLDRFVQLHVEDSI